MTWHEIATGVTDAFAGLDSSYNPLASSKTLWVSFIRSGTPDPLAVWARAPGLGNTMYVLESDFTGTHPRTSVSAYDDNIIIAYEYDDGGKSAIRYRMTYDGGSSWSYDNFNPSLNLYSPDVTARGGQGIAMVMSVEAGSFDPVFFFYRDGYIPGDTWDAEANSQLNEVDIYTGYPTRIEWLPPLRKRTYGYGVLYQHDASADTLYFDRTEFTESSSLVPSYYLLLN